MAEVLGSHPEGLSVHGFEATGKVHWNLPVESLVEMAVERGEGVYNSQSLVTETGERTGRSPNDKFIVEEPTTSQDVNWGDVNISTI